MFTGLWPWEHKLLHQEDNHELLPRIPTLMDHMAQLGYKTYGRVNFPKWGPYFNVYRSKEFADETYVQTISEWENMLSPKFGIFHTDDCHVGDYKVKGGYEAAISITDSLISRAVDDLRAHGDPIIIFTADHGEHPHYLHNYHFFDEVIRIPLYVSLGEDAIIDESIISKIYQHVDLPSLIQYLTTQSSRQEDGLYYWRHSYPSRHYVLLRGDCRYLNTIPVEQYGAIMNGYKLVRQNTPDTTTLELYQFPCPPDGPPQDLSKVNLEMTAFLDTLMAGCIDDYRRHAIVDQALANRLRELRYLE